MRPGRDPPRDADVRMSFAQQPGTAADRWDVGRVTIEVLPDVALLEIFDCHLNQTNQVREEDHVSFGVEAWHTLVHVCRKWRSVVFGSPCRLNLRLYCTEKTPVREMLAVWPPLPIVVWKNRWPKWSIDNIMAALEHNDRVRKISLEDVTSLELEEILAPMQKPYPALTFLEIGGDYRGTAPVVPESFLGGSAPRLRHLKLNFIPFPGLPKLLLSATHLVYLHLWAIPNSGYITPEAIVAVLSTLTGLEGLLLAFESPLSRPKRESRPPPPLTRSIFPALTRFRFKGASEYLGDLVARIDTPLLDGLDITFFHQLIFDTPQLTQFISRTPNLLETQAEAHVVFSRDDVWVRPWLPPDGITPPDGSFGSRGLDLKISCLQSDWQLSSLAQIYSSVLPQALIHMTEHLYIEDYFLPPHWQDDIEDSQWLEVLHPFTSVKNLYVSQELIPCIARALKELVGERVIEVLPALQSLFLRELHPSRPVQEAIWMFIAARQLADHSITVSHWRSKIDEWEI
jgi:hypothetical protein